jgi:hypothetical protein
MSGRNGFQNVESALIGNFNARLLNNSKALFINTFAGFKTSPIFATL